jgi:ligand-binding sensor domain-containing protein
MRHLFLTLSFVALLTTLCAQSPVSQIDITKGLYAFTFQEDKKGNVWIGLSNGDISGDLGFYNGSSFKVVSGSDSIPSGSYHNSIKLPDGSLFFGGNVTDANRKPVLIWVTPMDIDTIRIPFSFSDPFINHMSLINRREVWIGTASGLLVNNRGQWTKMGVADGLPNNFVTSIIQDYRGIVWVATEGGVVSFIDGILHYPESGSRIINKATALFSDSKGYVWCGARFASEGVSVYNGQVWETFSGRNGLIDNSVSVFHQDPKGVLWVGSCFQRNRGGVSSFNGKEWNSFSFPETLAKPCIDAIASDAKGNVWFGGSLTKGNAKGISVFDGKEWFKVGNSNTLKAERVIAFYLDSKDRLWVSSFEGLFLVQPTFNPSGK